MLDPETLKSKVTADIRSGKIKSDQEAMVRAMQLMQLYAKDTWCMEQDDIHALLVWATTDVVNEMDAMLRICAVLDIAFQMGQQSQTGVAEQWVVRDL